MPTLVIGVAAAPGHAWPGSPESPARIDAVLQGLRRAGIVDIDPSTEEDVRAEGAACAAGAGATVLPSSQRVPVPASALAAVCATHTRPYLNALAAIAAPAKVADADDDVEFTYATPSTPTAALAAAAAVCRVVDAVCDSGGPCTGLALVRPPGHHAGPGGAEPDLAASAAGGPPSSGGRAPSGFCFISNAAVGAAHARAAHARTRPLVVDVDVHVGDGTQAALRGWGRGDQGEGEGGSATGALVIDLHEAGVWPADTGGADDVGGPPGVGPAGAVCVAGR
jgi:acetoin utilization deacetylase AcuC-like enzyme